MIKLSGSFIIVFIMLSTTSLISLIYYTYNGYLINFDYEVLSVFYQLKSEILRVTTEFGKNSTLR